MKLESIFAANSHRLPVCQLTWIWFEIVENCIGHSVMARVFPAQKCERYASTEIHEDPLAWVWLLRANFRQSSIESSTCVRSDSTIGFYQRTQWSNENQPAQISARTWIWFAAIQNSFPTECLAFYATVGFPIQKCWKYEQAKIHEACQQAVTFVKLVEDRVCFHGWNLLNLIGKKRKKHTHTQNRISKAIEFRFEFRISGSVVFFVGFSHTKNDAKH